MAAKDLAATLRHVTPAGREATVKDLLGGTLVAMAMSDPDVPTVVGKPPTKAELETQRKNYRTAQGHLRQALKPHGLDSLVGKPVTPESEAALMATISAALPKTDSAMLTASVLSAMDKIAPIVGMPKPEPQPLFTFSAVTDYQVREIARPRRPAARRSSSSVCKVAGTSSCRRIHGRYRSGQSRRDHLRSAGSLYARQVRESFSPGTDAFPCCAIRTVASGRFPVRR